MSSSLVVPEYCLQPLNSDDCGAKPTAVMTYWKPGSRCEIDIWRGCPTANKFEDEYNCSSTCIFNAPSSVDGKLPPTMRLLSRAAHRLEAACPALFDIRITGLGPDKSKLGTHKLSPVNNFYTYLLSFVFFS